MSFENGDETVYATYPTFETPNLNNSSPTSGSSSKFLLTWQFIMSDWSQQSRSKIMLNNRKACSSHKLSTLGSCYSIIKMREQIKIHSIVLHCFVVQSALSFQGFVSKPEFEAYCFVLSLKPSTKNSCNDPKDFVIVPKR